MSEALVTPSRKRATLLLAAGGYINTAIVMVQGLVLIPLYLYYLGAHTYGLWLASGGMLAILSLMNFGISSMLIQRISSSYGQNNFLQVSHYFCNGLLVYLCICCAYGIAGCVLATFVPSILNLSPEYIYLIQSCFKLALLAMLISIFNECLRSLAQALLLPVFSMISLMCGRIIGIIITILMLTHEFGLWAIPVALLVSEVCILLLNIFYTFILFRRFRLNVRFKKDIIKEYLQTSPALFTARIGDTTSQEAEPLVITVLFTPELTTAYMITRKAADMVSQLLSIIYGAVHSAFSNLVGVEPTRAMHISSFLLILVFSSSLVGFITYILANELFIKLWVGEEFSLQPIVIIFIGLGFFMRSIRSMLWQLLNGWGDFIYSSYIILSEGCIRLILMIIFLQYLGIIGIPLAMIFASSFSIIWFWFRLRKSIIWSYKPRQYWKLLLSTLLLFGLSFKLVHILPTTNTWPFFILYLGICLSTIFIVFIAINKYIVQRCFKEFRT